MHLVTHRCVDRDDFRVAVAGGSGRFCGGRRVDPDGGWSLDAFWGSADEALGMPSGRRQEEAMAGIEDLLGAPVMDLRRGEIGDPGVPVLVVVPGEELLPEGAALLDRAEAVGELRAVLECLELRLREGVVVRDVRPAVG